MTGKFCYIVVSGNRPADAVGAVIYGELGYYRTTYQPSTLEECRALVNHINAQLGITAEVENAMKFGSMFGWDVPAAAPAHEHFKAVAE